MRLYNWQEVGPGPGLSCRYLPGQARADRAEANRRSVFTVRLSQNSGSPAMTASVLAGSDPAGVIGQENRPGISGPVKTLTLIVQRHRDWGQSVLRRWVTARCRPCCRKPCWLPQSGYGRRQCSVPTVQEQERATVCFSRCAFEFCVPSFKLGRSRQEPV